MQDAHVGRHRSRTVVRTHRLVGNLDALVPELMPRHCSPVDVAVEGARFRSSPEWQSVSRYIVSY